MTRILSYMTCVEFANKYKISLNDKNGIIPQKKLMNKIYDYELKNNVRNGLYFYWYIIMNQIECSHCKTLNNCKSFSEIFKNSTIINEIITQKNLKTNI